MSLIIINILAYLAILALLAFFGIVAWAVISALHIVNEVKGSVAVINPPKLAALQIFTTSKGIALKLAQRGKVIAGYAKAAAGSVTDVKDDVTKVVKSIDVQAAKDSAQEAAESVRHSGSADAMAFVKQIVDTLNDAQKAQNSRA